MVRSGHKRIIGIKLNNTINPSNFTQNTLMGIFVFLLGAFAYYTIEILFRGYSHWSMALTGGACLLVFSWFVRENPQLNIIKKALVGAVIITTFEFCVGLVVNMWYGWMVWDYTNEQWNFMGQVCLRFTAAWFLLCFAVLFIFQKGRLLYGCLCRIIKDRAYLNKRRQI